MSVDVVVNRATPDYRFVEKRVEDILEENSVISPPVSPKEIAQNYVTKVLFAEFPEKMSEVMGFYDCNENQIYVNANDAVNRQTFTIAHELGHAILHRAIIKADPNKYKVLLRRAMGSVKDPLEQEANAFAARLLVPKKFLDKYYKIASVEELARLFVVSEEVIRYRLKLEYGI